MRKVGRLTEITQHLVNGWWFILSYEGGNNMTVKKISKLINLNESVSIIDKKDILNNWRGDGKNIPLSYCDNEVTSIYSESLESGDSGIVLVI